MLAVFRLMNVVLGRKKVSYELDKKIPNKIQDSSSPSMTEQIKVLQRSLKLIYSALKALR